ncbi:MAG TPA: YceI family protein, partial [Candidatus Deferrimicrobiaceae bacterium]
MRKTAIFITVLCFAAPDLALSAPWELDPVHTGVHFKVRHLMVSSVRGVFEKVSGTVTYDESDITRSTADITIDAASINTRDAKRDGDLRNPDFLHVAKYPSITFKSKKVEKAGDGRLKMTGDLTIKGVTKEVDLLIEGPTPPAKDPWGNTRVGGSATTR